MSNIDSLVIDLAKKRHQLEINKQTMAHAVQQYESTPGFKQLSDVLEYSKRVEKEADEALRIAIVNTFKLDHIKSPHPAYEVKEFDAYQYNPEAIRQWCLSNLTLALKLDTKVIEKPEIASKIPGVVVTKEPRVFIKSDLSAYIKETSQ